MVDTNIKHGTFVPKQNHKHPYSFCLKESAGPGGVRRLHEYNLWYFRQHFPNLDTENVSVTQIVPCLAILLKKSDIVNNVKKSTVNSLASTHFQLCFKYIIPGFTILFVPSNFKPCSGMGLNFHIVHPCQP